MTFSEIVTENPFYYYGLTLIPVWISNYIHYKVWGEIADPFPNFNSVILKVGKGKVILSHTLLGMGLHIRAGFKFNSC